jgi:hypothetical protein
VACKEDRLREVDLRGFYFLKYHESDLINKMDVLW